MDVVQMTSSKSKIRNILENDVAFDSFKGPLIYRVHGFPAKFYPQLPRYFVQKLINPDISN
jgi:hypothetical protein